MCFIFGIVYFNIFDNKMYIFYGKCNYVMVKILLELEKLKVVVNYDVNCDFFIFC